MPHRYLRAIEPIVAHGLREMSVEGASLPHTLRQVALMAALVGSGIPPTQAIRMVEAMELEWLRWHPGEAVEPYHYGKGKGMPMPMPLPAGYGKGKGMPTGFGKGMGMPAGYGQGKGMPTGFGKGMGSPPGGEGLQP